MELYYIVQVIAAELVCLVHILPQFCRTVWALLNEASLVFAFADCCSGRVGRSYSDPCLEILTGLLALKQDHITAGKTLHIHEVLVR